MLPRNSSLCMFVTYKTQLMNTLTTLKIALSNICLKTCQNLFLLLSKSKKK